MRMKYCVYTEGLQITQHKIGNEGTINTHTRSNIYMLDSSQMLKYYFNPLALEMDI